jgi:hypothetical protein
MTGLADNRDGCTPVCLGLTCRAYYQVLKRLYPQPIPLSYRIATKNPLYRSPADYPFIVTSLDTLLRDFFGPQYRLAGWLTKGETYFLRRDVYGDFYGPKELELRQRYEDYNVMTYWRGGIPYRGLSNPFDMGEGWYEKSYTRIRRTNFPWWGPLAREFWCGHIEETHVFKRMVEEDLWLGWREWAVMVAL